MKCLIVKVKDRKRTPTYKKMISGKDVYSFPSNLDDAIEYSPSTLHEENEWYMITSFSKTTFCIELLKEDFSSVNYEKLSKSEVDSIDYLCSIQDDIFYFQNISKSNLRPHNFVHIGDDFIYEENSKNININITADAIYVKQDDKLYFQSLSKLTKIFKGIEELYREATDEETTEFLNLSFINLTNGYSTSKVKTANRKRITMALETLSKFNTKEKKQIFKYISKYCNNLEVDENNRTFSIGSEEELKELIYGIEQRYYTTEIGNEKRLAALRKNLCKLINCDKNDVMEWHKKFAAPIFYSIQ